MVLSVSPSALDTFLGSRRDAGLGERHRRREGRRLSDASHLTEESRGAGLRVFWALLELKQGLHSTAVGVTVFDTAGYNGH